MVGPGRAGPATCYPRIEWPIYYRGFRAQKWIGKTRVCAHKFRSSQGMLWARLISQNLYAHVCDLFCDALQITGGERALASEQSGRRNKEVTPEFS